MDEWVHSSEGGACLLSTRAGRFRYSLGWFVLEGRCRHIDGPPERLLERCRDKIEQVAHPKDQASLKSVAQVPAQLKFPHPELWSLLGGKTVMAHFPLIQELRAEAVHEVIFEVLKDRFGPVPRDVSKLLRAVLDEKRLKKLTVLAARCPDMAAFREALLA